MRRTSIQHRTLPLTRTLSDSMLLSEWADHASHALESGESSLISRPGWNMDPSDEAGALENAKTFLRSLKANQQIRIRPANDDLGNSVGLLGRRYSDRLILKQSVNATIVQAKDREAGKSVILKVYDKHTLNNTLMTKLEMEKLSLERARNKNVVDLLQVLDDESTCVLVFENCVLGDLVRQVVLHDKRPLEAYVFPTIIKPVLLGLQHMHKQGIVHCGICPTHVLMRSDKSVCLCDFFHAFDTYDDNCHKHRHREGHLDYMPPELMWSDTAGDTHGGANSDAPEFCTPVVTPAVDVWQVGCLAFELLTGKAPFEDASTDRTAMAILYGHITEWPAFFKPNSISFIKSCLHKAPERRPTIKELLQHPVLEPPTTLKAVVGLVTASKSITTQLGIHNRNRHQD